MGIEVIDNGCVISVILVACCLEINLFRMILIPRMPYVINLQSVPTIEIILIFQGHSIVHQSTLGWVIVSLLNIGLV